MQERFMLGNTEITVCRDYVVKTEEEKIAILTDLKKLAYEVTQKNEEKEEMNKWQQNKKRKYTDKAW